MNSPLIPGSVMVGVDGSPSSDIAVLWAATFAHLEFRPLAIVHATGFPVVSDSDLDLAETQHGLRLAARVTDRAVQLVSRTRPELAVSVHLELGEPREVLVAVAGDVSVLVVGTRGRPSMAGLLLGSVSVALTAHAPCPVVVARSPDFAMTDDLPIVVGADGSAAAAGALTFAFELAGKQRRPLHILHAAGDTWLFPAPAMLSPDAVLRALALDQMKFPDVVVHSRLVEESAAHALVSASEQAAVVVVGSRGRSDGASRLLGSVSRSVVEHAHCTVVVVRPAGSGARRSVDGLGPGTA